MSVLVAILLSLLGRLTTGGVIWDGVSNNFSTFNEVDSSHPGRAADWALIFPGTKWCGAGNISTSVDDLGSAADTDKCCRTHDFCDDIIEAGETKHNLTNTAFYTRLHCNCDQAFYDCLKKVNSKTSNKVGYIYFSVLDTKCFREEYPIIRCKRYKKTITRKYCVEYEYDRSGQKAYQWFDVPVF